MYRHGPTSAAQNTARYHLAIAAASEAPGEQRLGFAHPRSGRELDCDVADRVFLAADVAGFADFF